LCLFFFFFFFSSRRRHTRFSRDWSSDVCSSDLAARYHERWLAFEERSLPLSVVLLAAGQGKRMHSDLPKVLQPLSGRPLLAHVIDAARALDPAAIHVVYGYGGDRVRAAFPDPDLVWSLQAEQLGTGHAVAQALPAIPDDHTVLILCGDVPLVRQDTLRRVVAAADGGLALLTARVDPPTGYGRV